MHSSSPMRSLYWWNAQKPQPPQWSNQESNRLSTLFRIGSCYRFGSQPKPKAQTDKSNFKTSSSPLEAIPELKIQHSDLQGKADKDRDDSHNNSNLEKREDTSPAPPGSPATPDSPAPSNLDSDFQMNSDAQAASDVEESSPDPDSSQLQPVHSVDPTHSCPNCHDEMNGDKGKGPAEEEPDHQPEPSDSSANTFYTCNESEYDGLVIIDPGDAKNQWIYHFGQVTHQVTRKRCSGVIQRIRKPRLFFIERHSEERAFESKNGGYVVFPVTHRHSCKATSNTL